MATTPEIPHIPHFPVPDIKGAARWAAHHWKPIGLTLATLGGGTYLAFAHDRGPSAPPLDNAPVSDTFKPGSDQPSIVVNPLPSENAGNQDPAIGDGSGPQSPEVVSQSCEILPSEYSKLLRPSVIEYLDGSKEIVGLVAHLPTGVPIFALQGGLIDKVRTSETRIQAGIVNPDDPTITKQIIAGRLKVNNMNEEPIEKGNIAATIDTEPEDSNVINFSVTYSQRNPAKAGSFIVPLDLLSKACGGVLTREPKITKVNFTPQAPVESTNYNNTYRRLPQQ